MSFLGNKLGLGRVKSYFSPDSVAGMELWLDSDYGVNAKTAKTFDGSTDAYNADALVSDLSATTAGIWSMWVKPDAMGSTDQLISFNDTDANEFMLMQVVATTDLLRFYCRTAGAIQWVLQTDASPFTDGVWTHICIVQDGVTPVLYADGVAVAQTFTTDTTKSSWFSTLTGIDNGRLACFKYNSGANASFFDGSVDELMIWTNATAVTIASLYNSGSGKNFDDLTTAEKVGLVGSYSMDDLTDESGNSNDIVAIGTPSSVLGKVQKEANNGDAVFQWLDKSGNANHVSNTVYASQPVFNSTGFGTGSKPFLNFATDDFFNITTELSSTNYTTFHVHKRTGTVALGFGSIGAAMYDLYATETTVFGRDRIGYATYTTTGSTVEVLFSLTSGGTERKLFKNGTEVSGSDSATARSTDFGYVGRENTVYADMELAECIHFSVILSDIEISRVNSYLNDKYSLY